MRGRKPLNLSDDERREHIKQMYREGQRRYYKTKYGFLKTKVMYYKKKFQDISDFKKEFDLIPADDIEKL
jgi:hypothetical protein